MVELEYVVPSKRDGIALTSCSTQPGNVELRTHYLVHKVNGSNMMLRKTFINKAIVGIERDGITKKVNEANKSKIVFNKDFMDTVMNYPNLKHKIIHYIRTNIIQMGMNYGKISEILFTACAKVKMGY